MSDPVTYLSGPDSKGLWSLIHRGSPVCRPGTVEACEEAARQYRLLPTPPAKLPRWTDGEFVSAKKTKVECASCKVAWSRDKPAGWVCGQCLRRREAGRPS